MSELKITYLVDTENINTCWINIFKNMKKQDQMLLFYTENTPYLSYEYMNDLFELERRPEMIRCKTGRNALDFQLVSHLGYLIHNDKSQSYVIVTKDKAYKVVAEYWTEKGFRVECCTPDQIEKQMKKSGVGISSKMPVGRKAEDPDAVLVQTEEMSFRQEMSVPVENKKSGVMELFSLGRKKKKDGRKDAKKELKKAAKKKEAASKDGNKKEAEKKEAVKKDIAKKDTAKKEIIKKAVDEKNMVKKEKEKKNPEPNTENRSECPEKKSSSNEQVLKALVEKQVKQDVKRDMPQNSKAKNKNVRAELGKMIPKELKQEDKKLLAELESFIKKNGNLDPDALHQRFIGQWGQENGEKLYQLLKDRINKFVS